MASEPLRGVIAPNLTPFNDDLSIAQDLYVANAKRLLREGCVALAPFGTTGEALSVGVQERIDAIKGLIDSGVPSDKLIPGTGLTSLPDTADLSRACADLGCAGVMTLPPFYYKGVTDEGLYAYFARLIEMIDRPGLRVYLYHIPQVAGVGIPVDVVRRLRAAFPDQIVGIKDSSGDWDNTRQLFEIDGLIVYPGSELPLMDALALGGPGCISATANLNADAIARVINSFQAGEMESAARQHEAVRRFRLTIQSHQPIPAQKRLMAHWSGDHRWANLRPPLMAMSQDAGRELASVLRRDFDITGDSAR